MDPDKWADLMAQMRGDFSHERDPERRRILEKLSKRGMSFGGGGSMDTEQLRNMEKMLDGINLDAQKFKGGGAGADAGEGSPFASASSMDDADVDAEDKM